MKATLIMGLLVAEFELEFISMIYYPRHFPLVFIPLIATLATFLTILIVRVKVDEKTCFTKSGTCMRDFDTAQEIQLVFA